MEKRLSNALEIRHISDGAKSTKEYIDKRRRGEEKSLKTSFEKFNSVFLDGLDWYRILTIGGLSGCLGQDTIVNIKRGRRVSGRSYTIKQLYEKFHGHYKGRSKWNNNTNTYIRSYKEDKNFLGYNRVLDVVYSGKKELYRLTTKSGKVIDATLDHKFLTAVGIKDENLFLPLKSLKVGDSIVIRNRKQKNKKQSYYRKSYTGQFKYYPHARKKLINGKIYYECLEQRAVYDSHLNGFTNYLEFLKACSVPNTFIFSDPNMEIHHKDGDTRNNLLGNLELLDKKTHSKEHLIHTNHLYHVVLDEIISIENIGIQDTYDICCQSPYNNFEANDFIVHNSGKSTILENLKNDFIELNDNDFDILSFEFEMRIEDQLARQLSSKMDKSVKELYSAKDLLSDEDMIKVEDELNKISSRSVYYVDNVGTVQQIIDTIMYFVASRKMRENNRGIVVTIDHLLLTQGKNGEGDKDKIDNLMHQLVALKKYFSSIGVRCLFVCLSQLNRDIKSGERILNKKLHYPTENDIFAASSIYQCSDYVMISHRPATINGIGDWYGPEQEGFPYGLPVYCPDNPKKSMIYWHVIKERFGNNKIIPLVEDFAKSRVLEYTFKTSK